MTELDQLRQEVSRLQGQLLEAEETIRAIHDGRVDAFVVGANQRDRVYLLESIDGPFRILVERMQQGAVTVAADGTVLYANRQLSSMLDRLHERLVGRQFRELVIEEDRALYDALVTGEVERPQGEIRLLRADRSRVSVYLSAGALSSDDGGETCLLVTDLTQQKQHEALIAAETLARSMLEQAADAVVVCDPDGVVVLASPAAHEICGRNPLWQPFAEVLPLTVNQATPAAPAGTFELSRLTAQIRGVEVSLQCAEVTPMRLLLSASPVRDGRGAPLGSVVTLADIGALKRAEDELKEADRRKDEFLAMLAHELRNPLAPIVSGLEVLRLTGEADQQALAVFGMMDRQVKHLVRLVDDLLEVSRIARGKIELRKEVLDFADVLTDALQASRPAIDALKHQFEIDVPEGPLYIQADGVRLTQIISNLLNNAAKYTPPGGRVSLTARLEDEQLIVRVKDNGYGIDPRALNKVFDMFSQTRLSSRAESGLGVGLALVRTLVDMHGGSVSAASEGRGHGSEFTVRLPIGDVSTAGESTGTGAPSHGSHLQRVLIVDDNEDSASSLGLLLNIMDCDVKVALDGPSALRELESFQAEAVFLDIDMPSMDGYEVARRIRQRDDLEEVVLVAVTGLGQEDDRVMSRDAGFDHHLLKPVAIDSLRAVLSAAAH